MTETRTVRVAGDQPYDVVIGRNLLGAAARPGRPGRPTGARACTRPRWRRPPTPSARTCCGARVRGVHRRGPGRRGGQDRAGRRRSCWQVARPGRLHALRRDRRRRRRCDDRPRRVRRRDLAARDPRGAGADDAARAWSTRPSAARPASTPPRARTSSAPSTRRPGVLCDLAALESMPRHDFVAGLAEVVKCGFIADPRILELVEANAADADRPVAAAVVAGAARARRARGRGEGAGRRGEDLREGGLREILNYGHTLRRTRSSTSSGSSGGTARRCRSAWSTSPSSRGWPGGCPTRSSTGTARSSRRSGCPSPTAATAGTGCWPRCVGTRRRAATCCGSSCSRTSASPSASRVPTRRCWPPRTPRSARARRPRRGRC